MVKASVSSEPRSCVTCGTSFLPTSNRQKYCRSCGRRESANCEVCGKLFQVNPTSTGRWCSRECSGIGRRRSDMKPRACKVCGDTFKPIRSNQQFCSQECYKTTAVRPDRTCPVCAGTYNSKAYAGTCSWVCAGVLRRKDPEGAACDACGKHIPWPQSQRHRFCSRDCRRSPIGTLSKTGEGYIRVRTKDGWPLQHRHVMEQVLGRSLEPWERVHHKNGRRDDNRPENLELWKVKSATGVAKDPHGIRSADYHCPGCRCGEPAA